MRIVTIGGGTGSFTLLSGLKKHPVDITAIISMADDGGSTGRLRDELGVLPPGDIRQCLVALSDSSDLVRELFNYRFDQGGLRGHSFGNLFLSAMERISGTMEQAINEAATVLNVHGEVIPVTLDNARLLMKLRTGKIIRGENAIDCVTTLQRDGVKKLYYDKRVHANPRAIKRLMSADVIVIGPGDLYTSLLPSLIVPGIAHALQRTKATIIFVTNLTNKRGVTSGFTIVDYIDAIHHAIGKCIIDFVLVNTKKPSLWVMHKYARQEGKDFLVTIGTLPAQRSYKIVRGDLLSKHIARTEPLDAIARTRSLIRHDSTKLAQTIMTVAQIKQHAAIIKDII
jgi:uncharacterized cofD-like protein